MTIKYSASAQGFFDTDLHRSIPDDAVTITKGRHKELLAGQAAGYEIVAGKRGRPKLRSLYSNSIEDARAASVRAVKREAARRIADTMPIWRQLNAMRENKDPGFHRVDLIRSASNLIEEQLGQLILMEEIAAFPVEQNPLWPDFDDGEIQ